jgi:hypothetical protein
MFMRSAYDAFGIDIPATRNEWVSLLFVRAADALARMIEAGKCPSEGQSQKPYGQNQR